MTTVEPTLEQRVQSLESKFSSLSKERARTTNTENGMGNGMYGWSDKQLEKARAAVIEAVLEGDESLRTLVAARIDMYGDPFLVDELHIRKVDFIVLDALPEILREAFLKEYEPIANLLPDDGQSALLLAKGKDWREFASTFH